MATGVSRNRLRRGDWSPDVTGGAVVALLGLFHVFVLQVGGIGGFLALLVGWPLVGGLLAARLSPTEPRVRSALAGTFGALVVTLVVFLTGLVGFWPTFVTANLGVSLWPTTFAVLLMLTVTWTVFGYAGGYLAEHTA